MKVTRAQVPDNPGSANAVVFEDGKPQKSELYVARQPILTNRMKVYGYELLYRIGLENAFIGGVDGAQATSHVITTSFLGIGIERLVHRGRAFINFDGELLLSAAPDALPPDRVVIELLESIEVDNAVVARCEQLKRQGFTLALDDVASAQGLEKLIRVADIIKVDFCKADHAAQRSLATEFGRRKALLAEKIETQDDFEAAQALGYSYFQGYFFARPKTVRGPDLRPSNYNRLRLIQLTASEDFELAAVEDVLKSEPELSYQLLRYLNSARFAWKGEIRSVRHALVLLGIEELRRWAAIVALCSMAAGQTEALRACSVVRAKFCENIGQHCGLGWRRAELFLMGLLSLLDAILNCPIETVVVDLHLASDIREALLSREANSAPAQVYSLVKAVELGSWEEAARIAGRLQVPQAVLSATYFDAVEWSNKVDV